jgi:CelD/BcsL family acetyltransferase involved in cellulose biosynthesis
LRHREAQPGIMKKISVYSDFAAMPEAYASLFDRAGASSFFLSRAWFENLHAHATETGSALRIYVVDADDGPRLVMPMWQNRAGGRRLCACTNFYSSYFAPIADQAADLQDSLDALTQAIAQETPAWDAIDVRPLPEDTAILNPLQTSLRNAGFATQTYFCFGNWYTSVEGKSFDAYYAALPSQLRNTIHRKTKALERSHNYAIDIVCGEEGLDKAIAAFEQVYRRSWKSEEPYPNFMPGLILTCARQGWLRLGICRIDGKPAAAQLWIVANGVASIYKLAYDEAFSRLSIGSLLTARLMRHAIDVDKVREIDYLTGDEQYKRDWMSQRRTRWGIVAFNPRSPRGLLSAARHIGASKLKSWILGRGSPTIRPALGNSGKIL